MSKLDEVDAADVLLAILFNIALGFVLGHVAFIIVHG